MHNHLTRAIEFLLEARGLVESSGVATMQDRQRWARLMEDAEDEMELAKARVAGSVVYPKEVVG